MSGEPLSRAAIAAMSAAEVVEREAELRRWAAAGGVDGLPAPPAPTFGEGHVFTVDEIAAMDVETFELHAETISAQLKAGKIAPRPNGNPKSVAS